MLKWLLLAAAAAVVSVIAILAAREKAGTKENAAKDMQPDKQMTGSRMIPTAQPVDYDVYNMSRNEKLSSTLWAALLIFAVGYVFYRSIVISLLITPLALLYPKYKTKELVKKRKNELNLQFKEGLYALSSSLTAGKSMEMAFKDALRDLAIQYPDGNAHIIREFEYIDRKLEMNETVEAALQEFADRAHIEDITNFVNVLQICKRSGGNLVQVIKNSTEIIRDKIEIRQEIDTMLSERRFEQKVLNAMPIMLLLFVSVSAADFMRPVFTTAAGRVVMTMAIVMLAAAYMISGKIMDIEV